MKLVSPWLLLALRIGLGILFFYSGFTKILDPAFSAAGYLKGAASMVAFYHAMLAPGILPLINGLNSWGQTLLGVSLLVGLGLRISAPLGAILMLLYYLPVVHFPFVAPHGFLVDEHIIYALALLILVSARAGRIYGLSGWLSHIRQPVLRRMLDWLD